ncbi:TraR/DksA C4-type zinc finger protein [Pantoea ananatis]|nr:TraR/DksA C4-type zinc finger protein [Pantoea ananatis]MDQ1223841.1 RNA polymerase-binding transcription factor DksA [Pantoea ananatis]MDR6092679.1 RNA polymerase-binding transcription factor DksA [Pantoea ananatis]NQE78362.1 conjugal transfer protein TraR [Pantoea ananatis]NQE83154.1 conjugal transfer protein TraR [Pantoea ananatis]PQK82679.1 conjugal transfer protein TraR [Pantoea ananatis]
MTQDLNDELAQVSTELFTQRGIDAIRLRLHTGEPSKDTCECCAADIPSARQRAVPGVRLCIGCQEVSEKKSRHLAAGR